MTATILQEEWIHGPYGEVWTGIAQDLSGKWIEKGEPKIVLGPSGVLPEADRVAVATAAAALPRLLRAILPLALCDAEQPPKGVAVEHWRKAVLEARAAHAQAHGEG